MLSCKTVGHSTCSFDSFIRLIQAHGIHAVIDIRSTPYSRHNPQFNRETVKTDLQLHDISYTYMGDWLGGRYDDPGVLLPNGTPDFSRVRRLPRFQEGIKLLLEELKKGYQSALMCAEKDPFDCHRFMLVSRELARRRVRVEHITGEEKPITQEELEERLLKKYGKLSKQPSLFDKPKSRDELLEEAYAEKNKEM